MRLRRTVLLFLTLAPVSYPQAVHRIGVRTINGVGELYDRQTNERFTPRGNNFIRLASQSDLSGGTTVYHSTFNPGHYDIADIESNLSLMQASGYNAVRVFLDCFAIANTTGGLSSSYLDNVADFLGRAKVHGLYVMFTTAFLPPTMEYNLLLDSSCCTSFCCTFFGEENNLNYLTPGGVQANEKFWQAFITGLQSRNVPFDAILAYELRNEMVFDGSQPPLSLTSGIVQTANGKSYNMASPADKQQMMDDNLVFWINSVRSTILLADPTALVWTGFPGGGSELVRSRSALVSSQADVVDLHPYLGFLSLQQLVQYFGIPTPSAKPIVMGEFGASDSWIDSAAIAALFFQSWEAESCQYGFSGWLLWTWDTAVQPGQSYWYAEAAGGVIDQALRPLSRPDPCIAASSPDLAIGSKVTASASLAGNPPELAIDGSESTYWNSGAFAPQWIEIDLAAPSTIVELRLFVAQSPPGPTVHDVYVQTKGSAQPQLVKEFRGTTQSGQILTWTPTQPLVDVTSVRVVTVASPSWVAWEEIEVLTAYTNTSPAVNSVLNGASFASGGIAPGEIATLFGANLTPGAGINLTSGLPLPNKFLNVSVVVNGSPAPLFAIDNVNGQQQINFQVPWEVAGSPYATIAVQSNGITGEPRAVPVLAAQPGIITYSAASGTFGVVLHANFQLVDSANPAKPGETVLIYCTGLGAVSSPPSDGEAGTGQPTMNTPIVTIGGTPAIVSFSGLAPGFVGLYQVNAQVPSGLAAANQPVILTMLGASSNTVLLPLK